MKTKPITARSINATLRKLGRHVCDITTAWDYGPTINCGGCAVYANAVAAELQRIGITVGGVVRGWHNKVNVADVRHKVAKVGEGREWNRNGIDFNHVGLEYVMGSRAYHYDAEFLTPAQKHPNLRRAYPGRLTVDELEALAGNPANWNPMFNRRRLIPEIEVAVSEAFAPYQSAVDARERFGW